MKKNVFTALILSMLLALTAMSFTGCTDDKPKAKSDYARIEITTVDQLYGMQSGNFYVLGCDLDLGGKSWKPLAVDGFDGQNHTISNFNITETNTCASGKAYSFLTTATWFENVKLENVKIVASEADDDLFVTFGVGHARHVEGITVTDSTMTLSVSAYRLAGILGEPDTYDYFSDRPTLKNCRATNLTITASKSSYRSGGIAARFERSKIENCFSQNVVFTAQGGSTNGGIVGEIFEADIIGCAAKNNTLVGGSVGGIVGVADNKGVIKGCVADGNTLTGGVTGGILSYCYSNITLNDCLSIGNNIRSTNITVVIGGINNVTVTGGIAGSNGGVVRSSLSLNNTFAGEYNKDSAYVATVARNSGTVRYVAAFGNNFDGVDPRNFKQCKDDVALTEEELKTPSVVKDKLKLDAGIWTLSDGEFPQINLNN